MDDAMLTTKDNPHNPFTEYIPWWTWDLIHGYNTCGRLAKLAYTSPDLPDSVNEAAIDQAMQDIVSSDPLGVYKIVTPKDYN